MINFIIRYPFVYHERSIYDSYFNHAMVTSILYNNNIPWYITPLSLFGFYPDSYPSGNPVLIAMFSEIIHLDIENTILLQNFILSIFSIILFFCITKKIYNNQTFYLLSSLIFSIMPKIIDYTYWDGSSRGLITILFPLILLFCLIFYKKNNQIDKIKILALILILFIIFLSIHRSAITILLTLVIFLSIDIYSKVRKKISILKFTKKNQISIIIILFILALIIQIILSKINIFYIRSSSYSEQGYFILNIPIFSAILNFFISYTGKSGLFLFVSIFGIYYIIYNIPEKKNYWLLLINLICLIPFLIYSEYVSIYIFPILAIFITIGIIFILKQFKSYKKLSIIFVMILILASLLFSNYMINRWDSEKLGDTNYTYIQNNKTFETGIYLNYYCSDSPILSSGHFNSYVATIYSENYPQGTPFKKLDYLVIRWATFREYITKPQEPYVIQVKLYNTTTSKYFIEDSQYYGMTTWNFGHPSISPYANMVHSSKYKIFDNGNNLLWYVR